MKEKYEIDDKKLIDETTEYESEKLLKKLKMVRNEFKTVGKYGMPLIKKQNIDLNKIELWCYTKAKLNDEENKNKSIHFFTYDWLFNNVYDKPEIAMEKLDQYYAVLTPEIEGDKINKIEWYADNIKIKTKFNSGQSFNTEFCVKEMTNKDLYFVLTGKYGILKSKIFRLENPKFIDSNKNDFLISK